VRKGDLCSGLGKQEAAMAALSKTKCVAMAIWSVCLAGGAEAQGKYKIVFDAGQHGYENFWFVAAPILIFVAIGAILVIGSAVMQRTSPEAITDERKLFPWVFFGFSLVVATMVLPGTLWGSHSAMSDLREGRYSFVEGPVSSFVPMPYEGHSLESFTVNGHRFSYSDNVMTSGFRNTASHGGPIRQGLRVRISYSEHLSGNLILRLEVAE
jgi:hypothetical protein